MTKAVPGYPRGAGYGVKTNMSPWSLPCIAQLPTRPSGPAGVTATATALTESIALTWSAPTTHADGTALKEGELLYYYVYHSKSNSIDITNPGTYEAREKVDAERYQFDVPDPAAYLGPYYFVVTAVNTEAMQSVASAEVGPVTAASQSTGPSVIDDWGAGNAEAILVCKARIFVKCRLPKTTWNGFSYYKVYFDVDAGGGFTSVWTYLSSERIGYPHAPLVEANKYKYKVTVVGADGMETAGSIHDNGGPGYQPNVQNMDAILADTIAAGTVISSGDMIARTFIGCIIQSTNWGAGAGSQIDLDNETVKLGGSTAPKFEWAGAALTIRGSIHVEGGPLLGQPGGANVLYDPGMEQADTPYWGDNGTREDAGGAAGGGNGSVYYWEMTRAGAPSPTDNPRDHDGSLRYIEVNEGEVWEFGGDLWSDGTCQARLMLVACDEDKAAIEDSDLLDSTANAWVSKNGSYTVSAGIKFLFMRLYAMTANGDAGYDNCYLRRADLDWSYIQNILVETAHIDNLAVTTAKIGNLQVTGAKIANATIATAKITDLTFDKITAATSTASLVIGGAGYVKSSNYASGSAGFKICGDGTAQFNDVTVRGTLDFANITRLSLSIIAAEIGAGQVIYGKIAANAVRTNELYIDGDVNFAVAGWHGIHGANILAYSDSGGTTTPFIALTPTNLQVHSGTTAGNDLWLIANDEVKITAGDDIELTAPGDVILVNLVGADPSVAGALWNDGGTVKISAG